MNFRRLLLPVLMLAALGAPALHAQTTVTCAQGQVCSDTNGNQLLGDNTFNVPTVPSSGYQNLAINNGLFGNGNTLTDGNQNAAGASTYQVLTQTYLIGAQNSMTLSVSNNNVLGSQNVGTGLGGGWNIVGYNNTITNGGSNVNILGSGFTVNGAPNPNLNYGVTLLGGSSTLNASDGIYIGDNNTVSTTSAAGAYGTNNTLTNADQSQVVGNNNNVGAANTVTVGNNNVNGSTYNAIVGNNIKAPYNNSYSLGASNNLGAANTLILGAMNTTLAQNQMILGNNNYLGADATNTTLIGNGCSTDRPNTLYICSSTLSGVANGVLPNDAVNMSQLNQGLSYLGGGASFNYTTGQFTAPSYVLSGGTFDNVGSALLYLDSKPSGTGQGPQGPQGPQGQPGQQGPQGPAGSGANVTAGKNIVVTQDANGNQVVSTSTTPTFSTVTTSNANSTTTVSGDGVVITPATSSAVTLSGAGLDNGGQIITGVANGQISPGSQQAINGGQLYAAQQSDRNWAKAYTDQAVQGLNDRIARVGATSAASAALASNYRDMPNSFAAGLGFQGGHNAIAVGYRHVSESQRVSWSIQGAISGSERSIGVGIGYGW